MELFSNSLVNPLSASRRKFFEAVARHLAAVDYGAQSPEPVRELIRVAGFPEVDGVIGAILAEHEYDDAARLQTESATRALTRGEAASVRRASRLRPTTESGILSTVALKLLLANLRVARGIRAVDGAAALEKTREQGVERQRRYRAKMAERRRAARMAAEAELDAADE